MGKKNKTAKPTAAQLEAEKREKRLAMARDAMGYPAARIKATRRQIARSAGVAPALLGWL